MNGTSWASIIALCGALVLAASAFRGHRVGASKMLILVLAWVAIFLLVTAVFAWAAGR